MIPKIGNRILTIYICLLITTVIGAQNNAWEYAFSDEEYEGSIINDILIVEDQVWLAGAKNRCHTPGVWIFDTSGQILEYLDLTLELDTGYLYNYGKVMALKYDSSRNRVMAVGQIAPADDVGARTAALYTLSIDGEVDSSFDFTEISDEGDQSVGFWDEGFLVKELHQFLILDTLYQLIDSLSIPINPFAAYDVEYEEDTLFVLERTGSGMGQGITSYTLDGDTINHEGKYTFTQFVLLENKMVTLDTNQILRTYVKNDFSPVDSVIINDFEKVEISRSAPDRFQIIAYNEGTVAEIRILDENLTVISIIESELPGEESIKLEAAGGDYFLSGYYYERLSQYGNVTTGIVPFVRKQRIENPSLIARSNLVIIDAGFAEDVVPDEPATYHVIVQNTGDQVIEQWGYHTSITFSFNCGLGNWYGDVVDVSIEPGEKYTFSDSVIFHHGVQDYIRFYVVGPNHMLHTDTNYITVHDFTTPTSDISLENMRVFPNPANGRIYLPSQVNPSQVMIIDQLGQVISTQLQEGDFLDISALNSGLYYLLVDTAEGNYCSKFIKH